MICLIWANLRHCFSLLHLKKQITQTFQREREGEREGHIQKKFNDRDEP